jgi:hypothetical protein
MISKASYVAVGERENGGKKWRKLLQFSVLRRFRRGGSFERLVMRSKELVKVVDIKWLTKRY